MKYYLLLTCLFPVASQTFTDEQLEKILLENQSLAAELRVRGRGGDPLIGKLRKHQTERARITVSVSKGPFMWDSFVRGCVLIKSPVLKDPF